MATLKEPTLEEIQARYAERGCTKEAISRFAERYPEHCTFRPDGTAVGIIPRLRLALELVQQGKGAEIPARAAALIQSVRDRERKIFDVEIPGDKFNPKPCTVRIVTDAAMTCVITVLPPEFRADMHAKKKHRELRRIFDEEAIEPEDTTESITLPPPVKVGTSLGDLLRRARSNE